MLDPRTGEAQAADLGYVVGCTSGDARGGGGLGETAVTEFERKHLVETDRHIAECEAYIAKQRDLIERAIQQGRSTEVAETTLEALEASLRTAELVLGHTLKGVRRTYDHHSYMEEKKAALEALASLMLDIVGPSPDQK
jgi:hypothetical protein